MLVRLKKEFERRRLKDPAYAFLFEEPADEELVCFDCEASSLDVASAEILTIGAVKIRGDRLLASRALHLTIKPEAGINADSIKVHLLREVDVAQGVPIREALGEFLRFVGPRPLVGYYLEYDMALVNKHLKPWLGIKLPNRAIEVSELYYDWKIKRHRDNHYTGNIDLRFKTILGDLNLPELPAHDALNDALMTALMFMKLTPEKETASP